VRRAKGAATVEWQGVARCPDIRRDRWRCAGRWRCASQRWEYKRFVKKGGQSAHRDTPQR